MQYEKTLRDTTSRDVWFHVVVTSSLSLHICAEEKSQSGVRGRRLPRHETTQHCTGNRRHRAAPSCVVLCVKLCVLC